MTEKALPSGSLHDRHPPDAHVERLDAHRSTELHDAGGRRVGVGDGEVDHPVRWQVAPFVADHRHDPADDAVADLDHLVAGRTGTLGHGLELPAEHRRSRTPSTAPHRGSSARAKPACSARSPVGLRCDRRAARTRPLHPVGSMTTAIDPDVKMSIRGITTIPPAASAAASVASRSSTEMYADQIGIASSVCFGPRPATASPSTRNM